MGTAGAPTTDGGDGDGDGDGTTASSQADSDSTSAGDASATVGPTSDDGASSGETGMTDDGPGVGECGNGVVEGDEGCDMPNGVDADGCNEDCTVSGAVLWSHSQAGALGSNEDLNGIAVDAEGNAYVCGAFHNNALGSDYWIRQYTAVGGLGWTVSVDGPSGTTDNARDIALRGDAVAVAGSVNSSGNDWRVMEYLQTGASGWSAGYNGPTSGSDIAESVAADLTGNVFAVGRHAVDLQGNDVHVRQYLPGGGLGWTASYTGAAGGDDRGLAVATDFEGNVIVAGYESVSAQGRNMWLRKYSPAGAVLWTVGFAGAAALDDRANGVATDAVGNIYVAGVEGTVAEGTIAWLRAYDPRGVEVWTETWAGTATLGATAVDVAVDSVGDVTIVGTENTAGALIGMVRKYDPTGGVRWSETYASVGPHLLNAVAVGPDDSLWVAGGVDLGIDGRDAWVARLGQ